MKLCLIALLGTACTINGQSYGPGSTTTPSGGGTSNGGGGTSSGGSRDDSASQADDRPPAGMPTSSMNMSERQQLHGPDEGSNTGLPQYPSAPQDPWLAVAGDQPKRRPRDQWTVRTTKANCTAAHDHCLEADTWFLVQTPHLARDGNNTIMASVAVFGPEGTLYAGNTRATWVRENYVAFHTVPATKTNLVPGAIVFGIPRPTSMPDGGDDAVQIAWHYGVVESVDLDLGVYKLDRERDTLMLTGARVAVFKWAPGGKVEILGGKAKNQLAVSVKDVFLPEK